ncbi:MAG: hypothetical protein C4293_06495, partial [Nitrospiraceae bacterium]
MVHRLPRRADAAGHRHRSPQQSSGSQRRPPQRRRQDRTLSACRASCVLVLLFAVMAALGALNLDPINQFARSFLAYLPHLFTAALILLTGYLLSNFVSQAVLIAAVNANLPPARLVAAGSRWAVQLAAAAMALEQLGIAQHIVVVGFGITLGGGVLAAAIAFGL